jgi:hypothetical protein
MAQAPLFASILDEAPTEVVFPPPLPAGTYLCIVGQPQDTPPSKAGNAGIKFPLRPIAALDDVDDAALQEIGGLDGKNLSTTFWITPDSITFLDQFHENCGLDLSDRMSRKMRNQEVVNAQVLAVVTHRMNEDNTRAFAEVKRTARAED